MKLFKAISTNIFKKWWKAEYRDKCEKCGKNEGTSVYLVEGYPSCICFACRREFHKYIMSVPEYKALSAANIAMKQAENSIEFGEAYQFYYDILQDIAPIVEGWIKG